MFLTWNIMTVIYFYLLWDTLYKLQHNFHTNICSLPPHKSVSECGSQENEWTYFCIRFCENTLFWTTLRLLRAVSAIIVQFSQVPVVSFIAKILWYDYLVLIISYLQIITIKLLQKSHVLFSPKKPICLLENIHHVANQFVIHHVANQCTSC